MYNVVHGTNAPFWHECDALDAVRCPPMLVRRLARRSHLAGRMDFETAMDEATRVSRAEALAEVKRHGLTGAEFITDLGLADTYASKAVLEWLGY